MIGGSFRVSAFLPNATRSCIHSSAKRSWCQGLALCAQAKFKKVEPTFFRNSMKKMKLKICKFLTNWNIFNLSKIRFLTNWKCFNLSKIWFFTNWKCFNLSKMRFLTNWKSFNLSKICKISNFWNLLDFELNFWKNGGSTYEIQAIWLAFDHPWSHPDAIPETVPVTSMTQFYRLSHCYLGNLCDIHLCCPLQA